jgi:hypothetical protein
MGRALLWQEALAELKRARAELIPTALGVAAIVLGIAVFPRTPDLERGLLIGVLVTTFVALVAWRVWVSSGLAYRLNGTWAEDATGEVLRESPGVQAVVPNLSYNGYDVDHVAITGAGVIAVETKWHSVCTPDRLDRDVQQAARIARSLRLELKRSSIPQDLFSAALVVWGPGARDLQSQRRATPLGPVDVIPGRDAETWFAGRRAGPVGADFAADLAREVRELAEQRGARQQPVDSLVVRWLARVK